MGEPATRPATYEDLLQVPEHLIAEIISGGVSQGCRHPSRRDEVRVPPSPDPGPPEDSGTGRARSVGHCPVGGNPWG